MELEAKLEEFDSKIQRHRWGLGGVANWVGGGAWRGLMTERSGLAAGSR